MRAPRWVPSALLAGSTVLVAWGFFVLSFKAEPSAVGRVLAALIIIGGASIGTAITGFVAAVALIGRARWATSAAWLAAAVINLADVNSMDGLAAADGTFSWGHKAENQTMPDSSLPRL